MRTGWRDVKLGDIAVIQSGAGFPVEHQGESGQQYPFLKVSDMNLPGNEREMLTGSNSVSEQVRLQLGARVFPEGSIIFPKVGGAIATNKKRRLRRECCVDNNIMGLLPKPEHVSSEFLYFWLLGHDLLDFSNRANPPSISQATVAGWRVLVPGLEEQERIVALLDEAFAAIDAAVANAEKNLANARELFESYIGSVFTRTGEGWSDRAVGEIADHSLGKMLDKQKNRGIPRPYLRNLNVRWFNFDLSDVLEMRFEDAEIQRYSVQKGDVVICEGGYPGRAAIWDRDETVLIQKALHRVRFHKPIHNRWFLYYLYFSDSAGTLRNHFSGAGIQHFTGTALANFRVPIAPPDVIAHHVGNFDTLFNDIKRLEALYERKLSALTELRQSILQKALAGELTAKEAETELAAA